MMVLVGIVSCCALVYVYLLVILRLAGKHTVAQGTPFDLIVALLVSDMPDNLIYAQKPPLQVLVAITTIVGLHILVTIGVARFSWLDRLLNGVSTPLVSAGELVWRGLRSERINTMELDQALREQQVDARSDIQLAQLETSGTVTVKRTPQAEFARKRDLV